MKIARRILTALTVLALVPGLSGQVRSFRLGGTEFLLDGKPFRIMAGEIHFQRIPREYWADRLMKVKAAGLNTVGTYVFWNALEPEPGQWDLSGGNDLAAFIRTAQRIGLWVIVRPGPYACAEWDFGGLPAWLLRTPDIKVRCSDPALPRGLRILHPEARRDPPRSPGPPRRAGPHGPGRERVRQLRERPGLPARPQGILGQGRDRSAALHGRRRDALHARGREPARRGHRARPRHEREGVRRRRPGSSAASPSSAASSTPAG